MRLQAVIGGVKWSVVIDGWLNLTSNQNQATSQSNRQFKHTSFNHPTVALNACAASPTTPRTLNTSSQKRSLCSRKSYRAEITFTIWYFVMRRCLYQDLHAYSKAPWIPLSSILFGKSLTSELRAYSGIKHMFFFSSLFISLKQHRRRLV